MPSLSPDTVRIVSEFAAGGALAAVGVRLTLEQVRKLRPASRRGASTGEEQRAELTDAKLFGEAIAGSLVAGFGAAWYLGALHSFENAESRLALAGFGFCGAAWAVMKLGRERLPGEPDTAEGTHFRAWFAFVPACITLMIAACEAYR